MTTRPTPSPTKRLTQLKEKMATLQKEEEKICQSLSQDLAHCLIHAQALEIDFDVLLGGMLEVVTQARVQSTKASPEHIQQVEAWQKAGQKFRQHQDRLQRSNKEPKGEQFKKQDHGRRASEPLSKAEKSA